MASTEPTSLWISTSLRSAVSEDDLRSRSLSAPGNVGTGHQLSPCMVRAGHAFNDKIKTITEGMQGKFQSTFINYTVLQEFGRVRRPVEDFFELQHLATSLVVRATPHHLKHKLTHLLDDFDGDERPSSAILSSVQVGFAVANLVMGNALLTVPYGFALCGWSAVIILGTCLLLYTAFLLGDVIEALEQRVVDPGYGDIAVEAFGERVAPLLVAFCCGECFFMLVFFFVFVGTSLGHALSIPVQSVILAVVPFAFLIKMVPARYMSVFSLLGLLLVLGACAACIFSGVSLAEPATSQSMLGTVGFAGVFSTMGAVAVCVSDHPVFPELYHSSNNKAAFQKGLGIGFMVFLLAALVLGVTTYASFGTSLEEVVLTNIGYDTHQQPVQNLPPWLAPVCNVVLSARCVQVMPNFLGPILSLIYGTLYRCGIDMSIPLDMESELSLLSSHPCRCLGRLLIIGSCLLLCAACSILFDDLMDLVESLVSSMFKSVNAFIIPCVGYYALCGSKLRGKPFKRFLLLLVLSMGVLYGVVGTITSLLSLSAKFTK